jgi:hypothetical protein
MSAARCRARPRVVAVMNLATVFRAAIAVQAVALLAQALLGGLAVSGSEAALDAHMLVGLASVPVGTLSRS